MRTQEKKTKLGLQKWHNPFAGQVNTYVDAYDPSRVNYQDVMLAIRKTHGTVDIYDMTADDAEMLGMRLIAAARMYREQEQEEADDEL